jgi:hypothetical protein
LNYGLEITWPKRSHMNSFLLQIPCLGGNVGARGKGMFGEGWRDCFVLNLYVLF